MDYKHFCVIDEMGNYVIFAQVLLVADESGRVKEVPQNCILAHGERLLDVPPPVIKQYAGDPYPLRPRWDGAGWVEIATPAEISAWEAEHPAPDPPLTGATLEARVEVLTELVDAMLVSQLMSEGAILHD